ncbi:FMRFamide receptor [Gryllus bimaculatus]|nr:FMRFamide receptor [Gryllus bimaculatus]
MLKVGINSSSSVWLTVSFTVERYIAVCHPLRGKVLCTESRARTVIAVVFVACALATITTPFEYKVVSEEAGLTVRNSDLGSDETYQTIFYWFSSITFTILPLILLGIFNSFLVWAVHRSQRQRFRMTQFDMLFPAAGENQTSLGNSSSCESA